MAIDPKLIDKLLAEHGHRPQDIAAQPLQFIYGGRQRRLTDDPHQRLRLHLGINIAAFALRAAIVMREFRMGDGNRLCSAIASSAVAPMPGGRLYFHLRGFRRGLLISEHSADLFCLGLRQQAPDQRVQRRFELLAIGLA